MRIIICIKIMLVMASLTVKAQDYMISGKVLDAANQEPLTGVVIRVKGSPASVTTNKQGRFLIPVEGNGVLQASRLGFHSFEVSFDVPVTDTLKILLEEDVQTLREVIVSTGYQQIPRERATGEFVHLNSDLINRRVSTGILDRIENAVPGLIFNRGKSASGENDISIRGRSTLFGDSQPLIVVDKFPYNGELSQINPNDVESITILKDAAAASIWGARAGNGVIVITTKKGRYNRGAEISFAANTTLGRRPDIYYRPWLSASDYIDVERMLFDRGFYVGTENSLNHRPLTPAVELMIAERDGKIDAETLESRLNEWRLQDVRKDVDRYLYQSRLNQQYALNIQGGSARHHYYLSAGWDRNREELTYNNYERVSLTASNTIKLADERLSLSGSVNWTKSDTRNSNPGINSIGMTSSHLSVYPYASLADDEGRPLAITRDYRRGFVQLSQEQGLRDWRYRPLDEPLLNHNHLSNKEVRATASADYRFLKGLNGEIHYRYVHHARTGRNRHEEQSYFTRNLINRYTQIHDDGLFYPVPLGDILDQSSRLVNTHNLRGQLTANYNWSDHRINAIAGYEISDQQTDGETFRVYGYNNRHGTSQRVDYLTSYSQFHYPAQRIAVPYIHEGTGLIDRFISWYFNGAYTFSQKYTVSASARIDRSNLFGVRTNQKGVPLWSAGFAWLISDESVYSWDFLPYLKLRLTYGENGNVDKSLSAYTTARYFDGAYSRTNLPYARIQNPPNPELRWEKVKTFNAALDFESKSSALTGTIAAYLKRGADLIGDVPYPASSGITQFRGNTASTRGYGLDIELNTRNLNGDFSWRTRWLFSYQREKIVEYTIEANAMNYIASGDGGLIYPQEGKPLFGLYSLPWAGLDPITGDPRSYMGGEVSTDYNEIISALTPENILYHGPARPVLFGSFNNLLSWKNISLSFIVSYRLGYYFRRPGISYYNLLRGQGVYEFEYAHRWRQRGDEKVTQVPSVPDQPNVNRDRIYQYSNILVERGDHIRLQDVRLTYQFPTKGLPLQRASMYLYANNLGILWKSTNSRWDPDYPLNNYPPVTTISFGVQATF